MTQHTQQPTLKNARKDNMQPPIVKMSRDAFDRVIRSAEEWEKETLSITMGISMESDPKQEKALTHYQYGPQLYGLIHDITTLNPKPKRFIVVVADYLHRHNLKIKSLLELLQKQNADFEQKKSIFKHVINLASNALIEDQEIHSSLLKEADQALIKEAEAQAEAEALKMGKFWVGTHTEESLKTLQANNIEYECHTWKEWYDSTDEEYNAKTNIPIIQSLYHTDSTFQNHINILAEGFLERISWLPKENHLNSLKQQHALPNAELKKQCTDILKDLLHTQYRSLLDSNSLQRIKALFRLKDNQITDTHLEQLRSILNHLVQLLELTQQAVIELSKSYLIEESAASKWFASLSSFSILTYKKEMNPAFAYTLEYFNVETKLPFVPYNIPRRVKPTKIDESKLTPAESAARQPKAKNNPLAAPTDSKTTTITQGNAKNNALQQQEMNPSLLANAFADIMPNKKNTSSQTSLDSNATTAIQGRTRSKSPSPDFQYNLIKFTLETLEQDDCTPDAAIEAVQFFINQKMKSLKTEEIADQAREILRLVLSRPKTPPALCDAVTTYLTSNGFIKAPTQSSSRNSPSIDDKNILQSEVTSNPQASKSISNVTSAAIPIRSQNHPHGSGHKRERSHQNSPSSNPSPPSRLQQSFHNFFRSGSSKRNRASSSARDLQPLPSSRSRLVESRRPSYSSDETRTPAIGA